MKSYLADVNIFLRFFIGDVPQQQSIAKEYFARARDGEIEIVLTTPVFFEMIYVLRDQYKFKKERIVEVLGQLLSMPFIKMDEEKALKNTLVSWAHKKLDLVDCYLLMKAQGLETSVLTFDKKLKL